MDGGSAENAGAVFPPQKLPSLIFTHGFKYEKGVPENFPDRVKDRGARETQTIFRPTAAGLLQSSPDSNRLLNCGMSLVSIRPVVPINRQFAAICARFVPRIDVCRLIPVRRAVLYSTICVCCRIFRRTSYSDTHPHKNNNAAEGTLPHDAPCKIPIQTPKRCHRPRAGVHRHTNVRAAATDTTKRGPAWRPGGLATSTSGRRRMDIAVRCIAVGPAPKPCFQ